MGGSRGVIRGWVGVFLLLSTFLVSVYGQAPVSPPLSSGSSGPASAPTPVPVPAPGPTPEYVFPVCAGVSVEYVLTSTQAIYPNASTLSKQPYKFEAQVTLANQGYSTLETWGVGLTYSHQEIMVSADGLQLEDGRAFPANVSDGAVLSPSPPQALKNSIETAGDSTQISKVFQIVGTEFGEPLHPMPLTLNITNVGYNCSTPNLYGNNTLHTCCAEPSDNITLTGDDTFLPSIYGDFTITYDVLQAYTSNYKALVTISNESPFGRLDNWQLSWTWQEGEFIFAMLGARPKVSDTPLCVGGEAAVSYTSGLDLNSAISCSPNPAIFDLPTASQNDTTVGGVKYCCRNGTILPAVIDPSKSKSAFTMQVYKLSPHNTDALHLVPPSGFKIGNESYYTCGAPRLLEPSLFPDPYLDFSTSAVKTWQVSCNVTEGPKAPPPTCCVSFSSYNNDSIVPCPTCACGCASSPPPTCSTNQSAMLLPYSALTLPPENRTEQILAWASILHTPVPNPLPCPDHCGVSLNWHIVSDYSKGWSARMSLFDWDNVTHPEWFAVLEMEKALPGFEKAYTFNATTIPSSNSSTNTSMVVHGMEGYNNYLLSSSLAKTGVSVLQSVFSFTKKTTPGIVVKGSDGFPTQVWFNGEKCAMPDYFPTSGAAAAPSALAVLALALAGTLVFLEWL